MKLKMHTREGATKGANKRMRREGLIPAVIYSQGKPGENIAVENTEFGAVLRDLEQGSLPATTFTLVDGKGHERPAIVKGIQYHVTTYNIVHMDFEELHTNVEVNVKVPIDLVGTAECTGVKLGGTIRQLKRHIRVRCLPKDLPSRFQLDVTNVGIRQSIRLKNIAIPASVKPIDSLEEIAVTVSKR